MLKAMWTEDPFTESTGTIRASNSPHIALHIPYAVMVVYVVIRCGIESGRAERVQYYVP